MLDKSEDKLKLQNANKKLEAHQINRQDDYNKYKTAMFNANSAKHNIDNANVKIAKIDDELKQFSKNGEQSVASQTHTPTPGANNPNNRNKVIPTNKDTPI